MSVSNVEKFTYFLKHLRKLKQNKPYSSFKQQSNITVFNEQNIRDPPEVLQDDFFSRNGNFHYCEI